MSRDSEKVLKELQKFLDAHAEDTENEADVDALAERFFAEYNLKCKEQKESAPETADDYLDLAEQVTSKKKRVEYLHKALELEPDNPEDIRARMAELAQKRKTKQPLEYPSAGSMFKRPKGYFAAALIEQCGLKGFAVGGAQVSAL